MDKANSWDRCAAVAWLIVLSSTWLSFLAGLWLWTFGEGNHFFWMATFWLVISLSILAVKSSGRRGSEEQAGYVVDFGRDQAGKRSG